MPRPVSYTHLDVYKRQPYGRYAQQAQLELGYVYWKAGETGSALAATDRFIKLHPTNPAVDYAYYLKGLISFNEDLGWAGYISTQDPTERDPKACLLYTSRCV